MRKGTLYIISAPSGTGKSSLIKEFIKIYSAIYKTKVSISHTTRTIRPGEYHGQHYFFVSIKEFEKMIENDAFLEYAKVFGNYYGTSKFIIENTLMSGYDIFLDIDWQGANQIHKKIPSARKIFILPPSKEELNRRLSLRGQDSQEIIFHRMSEAISEMIHFKEYDYLIINDDFYTALLDLKNIVCAEKLRLKNQKINYDLLIKKLLKN